LPPGVRIAEESSRPCSVDEDITITITITITVAPLLRGHAPKGQSGAGKERQGNERQSGELHGSARGKVKPRNVE
jgi:hypothetical protein